MDTVHRERPPFGCACEIYAFMGLYGSDGQTQLKQSSAEEFPWRLTYTIPATGTYYLRTSVWPGGIRYPYTLHFTVPGGSGGGNGPGDPPTVRADGIGTVLVAVISDPVGDFIVADRDANRVVWVAPDGRKQVIAQNVPNPAALGWDIFANLLIVGTHGVYKMDPQGHVTQLITRDNLADIALAPDGTIWVSDRGSMIHHYDPLGHLIADISINNPNHAGPNVIAIGPSGDVFYTEGDGPNGTTVYKLSGSTGQAVFSTTWYVSDIAIDANGNFYLTNPAVVTTDGGVYRYSQFGAPLDTLTTSTNEASGITFGRNADGTMNNRLFVSELGGRLVELNNSATPTAGVPVGFATQNQVIADLLKPGSLTNAQRQVLDAIGNKNGRYDVGDLRAFLIYTSTLSASHAH
jgi:sugar lactone lactonase YvrE